MTNEAELRGIIIHSQTSHKTFITFFFFSGSKIAEAQFGQQSEDCGLGRKVRCPDCPAAF